jgi:hypothetical protein
MDNDSGAARGLTPSYTPSVASGQEQDVFSLGIKHTF